MVKYQRFKKVVAHRDRPYAAVWASMPCQAIGLLEFILSVCDLGYRQQIVPKLSGQDVANTSPPGIL